MDGCIDEARLGNDLRRLSVATFDDYPRLPKPGSFTMGDAVSHLEENVPISR